MTRQLKEHEWLVRAGTIWLRAPDGTPLPAEPQYRIVNADEAGPARVVELQENKRLVLAGRVFNDMALAKERYAAHKEGREIPPREEGIPIYILTDKENVDPKTGLTWEEKRLAKRWEKI
ncbi:MAG: hypothetical protein FWG94_03755 [Oscillospiraceae bacterium]|nr:hypothetical protein [Oscillospiraceae bacterium]